MALAAATSLGPDFRIDKMEEAIRQAVLAVPCSTKATRKWQAKKMATPLLESAHLAVVTAPGAQEAILAKRWRRKLKRKVQREKVVEMAESIQYSAAMSRRPLQKMPGPSGTPTADRSEWPAGVEAYMRTKFQDRSNPLVAQQARILTWAERVRAEVSPILSPSDGSRPDYFDWL
eukprot:6086386-Lingulodinium_polyedra.AAC.1